LCYIARRKAEIMVRVKHPEPNLEQSHVAHPLAGNGI
jgi:hypothetical protein